MDDFDSFRLSLIRDNKPLTLDQLSKFWLRRNKDAIIKCAYAMLSEPAGQHFCILPLTFVAYVDEQAKLRYEFALHDAAEQAVRQQTFPSRSQREKAFFQMRTRLHVAQVIAFLTDRLRARFTEKLDEALLYHEEPG